MRLYEADMAKTSDIIPGDSSKSSGGIMQEAFAEDRISVGKVCGFGYPLFYKERLGVAGR